MMTIENRNGSIRERVLGRFAMDRRDLLRTGSLAAAGIGAGFVPGLRAARAATSYTPTDADVLNFALNLEYLEANYYLLGVTGSALGASLTGGGPAPTTSGPTQVPFQTQQLASYFERIAADEQAHVYFLRAALGGSAVAQPQIDLSAAFTTLAQAAGLITAGQTFNPFASEIDFLVGSYIFEDVGITAYGGGAMFLSNPDNIAYAGSVLAIEGYHAGAIRGYLASQGGGAVTNAISNLRADLSAQQDDNGTDLSASGGNPFNIVNGDSNAQSFRRSFNQVLNIIYGGAGPTAGLFFPNGVAGNIENSTVTYTPQA